MAAFLEQSFIQPEFESRTYDFEGQLALDEDLYGPKVGLRALNNYLHL